MNTSDRPRNLLLYEVAASDAWPLMGVKDFDEFNSRLLSGDPVIAPRMTEVPVRLPREVWVLPLRRQRRADADKTAAVDPHLVDADRVAALAQERDRLSVRRDDWTGVLVRAVGEVDAVPVRVDPVDLARDGRCAVGREDD